MEKRNTDILWNNKWLWTGILFILGMILSACKLVVLPQGGAVTYFSLLVLWLITYIFGFSHGLICSILFGAAKLLITYITNEHINYNIWALIIEYPLASGVFCLGGLIGIRNKAKDKTKASINNIPREPFKLIAGYLIGVTAQFLLYVISAVMFYPPDREGFISNLLYCMLYDGSYLMIEAFFTIILISIPAISDAIYYIKYVATHNNEIDNPDYF